MGKWSCIVALLMLVGCTAPDQAEEQPTVQNRNEEPEVDRRSKAAAESTEGNVSACLVQEGKRISEIAMRATGTEPFWGADVEGRCVTYSTPEDQDGTRIWTKFTGTAENGRWAGALDGQPFVLITRSQEGCSDGMSDFLYPIAVTLTVRGEQRTGCADSKAEWEKRRPA